MATKTYKADRRGKYRGCKVHLDEKDCQEFLGWRERWKEGTNAVQYKAEAVQFCRRMAKTIKEVLAENPDLLEERTSEQVKEALEKDAAKIKEQLAAMQSNKDWKQVK